MKTIEEIKQDIINTNPEKYSIVNDVVIELTDEEFLDAIEKRAEMELKQLEKEMELKNSKEKVEAKLLALGLTIEELKILGL